jgi:hypothetical protein
MQRRTLLRAVVPSLLFACIPALAQKKPCPAFESKVVDEKFKAGQVWTYENRPGEARSTLTILQVDRLEKLGIVVHIRVDGLQMHNPAGDLVPSIEHMPFTRDAMLISITHLVRTEASVPTLEGYEQWRHACGGVYTISVADAVTVAEKTFNSR